MPAPTSGEVWFLDALKFGPLRGTHLLAHLSLKLRLFLLYGSLTASYLYLPKQSS